MTLLHDYFHTRNLQGFQRLLDGSSDRGQPTANAASSSGGGGGSSYTGGGKSWTRSGVVQNVVHSMTGSCEPNARDWQGRTALHLACASLESIEYVRALLKHPHIDVNCLDVESHWTALHRALYAANFPAALLLLQRSDIDTLLKDLEGYTAYDLYNSTLNGTKPDIKDVDAELFTWGANRNAALGLGDENDRLYPDHVIIKSKEDPAELAKKTLLARFTPIHVRQIQMSKLHTAVITTEGEGNLRVCGFGSGGRLGPIPHTQYSLKPLAQFSQTVVAVALGQDHTLALTKSGEVFSWGLNRFSQLGYAVEVSPNPGARHEEPIQPTPKRVVASLRREVVIGVTASKNASACWTADTVYTWGTNTGQLGYDKAAHPVQVVPRPVTKFTNKVVGVAMTDTVLAGLLITNNVECIWNDRHYRVNFPLHAFPSGIQPYRPPQSIKDSRISKITSCDDTFAALSLNGEVFTFSAPPIPTAQESTSVENRGSGAIFKPQRVWALRKKFSAVKDVALGSDGSIIICTQSGHVFVRTRNTKAASTSGKTFRFERIPFLQRITSVCANSTGAFGALKINYVPRPIDVSGNSFGQDMAVVQPYLEFYREVDEVEGRPSLVERGRGSSTNAPARSRVRSRSAGDLVMDDEPEDASIDSDVEGILELCRVIIQEQRMREAGGGTSFDGVRLPHGADTMVYVQPSKAAFPVHRVILAARSTGLSALLSGPDPIQDEKSKISLSMLPSKPGPGLGVFRFTRLRVEGCHPLTLLIFLRYLYSDDLLAPWDRRIGMAVEKQLSLLAINPAQIKTELQHLARILELPLLSQALEAPVKRTPTPSMAQDMYRLFDTVQPPGSLPKNSPLTPDVALCLMDGKEVFTHSVILRARSPLFSDLFGLEDWTVKRWDKDGRVKVDLRHMRLDVVRFVMRYMCCGADGEIFDTLEFVQSVEELLAFMFRVLDSANELLLDRLVLLCSSVILSHANINNACYILTDATHYHAEQLIERIQDFISVNMETFLESGLLDDIPYALVKQLSKYVRQKQLDKAMFSRSNVFAEDAMKKHAVWLADQDIPEPIVKTSKAGLRKDVSFTRISPSSVSLSGGQGKKAQKMGGSALESPRVEFAPPQRMLRRLPSGDEIFHMDGLDGGSGGQQAENAVSSSLPLASPMVWKAAGAPRVDMKAVMAEAAASRGSGASSRNPVGSSFPSPTRAIPVKMAQQSEMRRNHVTGDAGPGLSTTPSKVTKPGVPLAWRMTSAEPAGVPSTPPASSSFPKDVPRPGPSPRAPPPPTPPRAPQLQTPGLGPVITPTRHVSSSKAGPRSNHQSGKAWTVQPQPITKPTSPNDGATKGVSFLAIQFSQQQQDVAPVKDKRSLREIQEEERSLQEEAEFLKWWTAEELKVRQEQQQEQEAIVLAQIQSQQSSRKSRGMKGKGVSGGVGGGAVGQSRPAGIEGEGGGIGAGGSRRSNPQQYKKKHPKLTQN